MTHDQLSQASVTALAQLRARGEAEWIDIQDACRVLNVSRERATQLADGGKQ